MKQKKAPPMDNEPEPNQAFKPTDQFTGNAGDVGTSEPYKDAIRQTQSVRNSPRGQMTQFPNKYM